MKRAETADKTLIVEILLRSFETNKSVNYIIKQDRNRSDALKSLMEYSYDMCAMFGDVWLADDQKACALTLYPQNKRTSLKALLLDILLILNAIGIGGIRKALNRESKIKQKQPRMPMLYLWFIGVRPEEQGRGTGSKLLQEVLNDAAAKGLPVYLETSTRENLPWYQRFGFKIYDQLELGYTLYFLRNR